MGHEPIPSKAAVKDHPLHPIGHSVPDRVRHGGRVADVAYLGDRLPRVGGRLRVAVVVDVDEGVVAGALGAIDYFGIERVREHKTAWRHGRGNAVVLVIVLANALWRVSDLEAVVDALIQAREPVDRDFRCPLTPTPSTPVLNPLAR